MAKQQVNLRLSDEADASSERLQSVHGYEGRTDAVEAALACWEMSLSLAAEEVADKFSRAEWNMMADICNGTMWSYGHGGSRPQAILAAEVEDGCRLNGAAGKWGVNGKRTLKTIQSLSYAEAWAVIRAVCWFWQHPDIDHQDAAWWTPGFRRVYEETK